MYAVLSNVPILIGGGNMNKFNFEQWYYYRNDKNSYAKYMITKGFTETERVIYTIICSYGGEIINVFPYEELDFAMHAMESLTAIKE